ncbi:unnamed protein product [Rhizoctonia solani]|uniref:Heterokaryon incompatibility domain-containing protein n=1 Tax=Rhizoctonia solani TaxID=456999 RepID=A0A8H3AFL7_9AGAM|nr:unnamed protein product [Rhizoctonia solani]
MRCSTFIQQGLIDIYEYASLLNVNYAIISYVWNGLPPLPGAIPDTFEVLGVDNKPTGAQPISVELLRSACEAADRAGIDLLWLDQLCMKQSDSSDKAWQMEHMHEIYSNCRVCYVFPGGLARFTDLNEETDWINRGWTLQEAIAPSAVEVIFRWQNDSCQARPNGWPNYPLLPIDEVTANVCAKAPLSLLLDSTLNNGLSYWPMAPAAGPQHQEVNIFGRAQNTVPPGQAILILPNVATLAIIVGGHVERDSDPYFHSIWKSTFMRSTKYRSDIIFSVMGLFGVSLSPTSFMDESGRLDTNDCIRPAIALVQKILERGRRATWLGISPFSPPCPGLTTFPSFPRFSPRERTSVVDFPNNRWARASRLMLNEYVDPDVEYPFPQVESMNDQGYLKMYVKCMPVVMGGAVPAAGINVPWLEDTNGAIWTQPDPNDDIVAYAALLCAFRPYSPTNFQGLNFRRFRGFILVRNRPSSNSWYIKSYFRFDDGVWDWWLGRAGTRLLSVGGHDPDLELHNYVQNNLARIN